MKTTGRLAAIAIAAMMALASGCGDGSTDTSTPEGLVRARIEKFNALMLECDFEAAKQYATQEGQKAISTFQSVLMGDIAAKIREQNKTTKLEILSVRIEDGTKAVARVKMDSLGPKGERVVREQDELALLEDGEWRVAFKK